MGWLCPWKRSEPSPLASAVKVRAGPEGTSMLIVTIWPGFFTETVVEATTGPPGVVTLSLTEETALPDGIVIFTSTAVIPPDPDFPFSPHAVRRHKNNTT
jgi:hypothetical protein